MAITDGPDPRLPHSQTCASAVLRPPRLPVEEPTFAIAPMKRLYVRDEDSDLHLGKRLRVIRGTVEMSGTLLPRDEALSPKENGELARAWVIVNDGSEFRFVPSDGWDVYQE